MTTMTEPVQYFVAKAAALSNLSGCHKSGVWACADRRTPPQPREVMSQAFKDGSVILIFSVTNCHGWHGYAMMTSAPGSVTESTAEDPAPEESSGSTVDNNLEIDISNDTLGSGSVLLVTSTDQKEEHLSSGPQPGPVPGWQRFNIKLHKLYLTEHGEQCLPFSYTEHLLLPGGQSVNKARNWQAVPIEIGQQMCHLIDDHYQSLSDKKKQKEEEKIKKLGDPFFQPIGSDQSPQAVWCRLVHKVQGLGQVLLACAFGSQRYNLHTAASDTDMLVVYAADTKDLLGFNPPKHTIKNHDNESCDYTIHEVHRYCELLLTGDPRCVETLFLHPSSIYLASDQWKSLCKHKEHFLTRQCMDKYLRDAQGAKGTRLLDKWVASGEASQDPMPQRVCKPFYIILRLLQNAREVAMGSDLQVYRPAESPERELLVGVRKGQYTCEQLQRQMSSLLQDITDASSTRSWDEELQETKVKTVLEQWLLALRYHNFKQYMEPGDTN